MTQKTSNKMKTMYMLIGNIGTGKSTRAKEIADEHDIEIFSADEIEFDTQELTDNEIEEEVMLTYLDFLDDGESFVLDGININSDSRRNLISQANRRDFKIKAIDCGPGDDTTLRNRLDNPRNISTERWTEIHNRYLSSYEAPYLDEGFDSID